MTRTWATVGSVVALLGARVASAQLCSGDPAFTRVPMHMAVNAIADNTAQTYTADIILGLRGFFGAVDFGFKTYDAFGSDSWDFGGTAGFEVPLPGVSRLHICPRLSWASIHGPQDVQADPFGTAYHYNEKVLAAGLSVGYVAARTDVWEFVPTAALTFGSFDSKLANPYGAHINQVGPFCCGRRSSTVLTVGIGLGLAHQINLKPSLDLPLSGTGPSTAYSGRIVFTFGP